jgi:hypothetical protein
VPAEIVFQKAEKTDLTLISQFRKKYWPASDLGRSCEPEYYAWKIWKNPVRLGEIWFAKSDNTIVGFKSMTPKRIKILDSIVDGAETGDTFTHPEYQRRGIFTGLFRSASEAGLDAKLDFIYGLPNEDSQAGYEKKLDYAQISIKMYGMIKPIFPLPTLKKMLKPSFLGNILSPVLRVAFKLVFKAGTMGAAGSGVSVKVDPNFPDDIDVLWEQTSKNYDVMLVRTRDYLEWRYVTNPDSYSILIARKSDGAISGYMVTKLGVYGGVPVGLIVDYLTLEDDPNIFKQLLISATKEFYRKKVSFVLAYTIKSNFYYKILSKTGFIPRGKHSIICYKNKIGNQVLTGDYRWHFTMGDSDNI